MELSDYDKAHESVKTELERLVNQGTSARKKLTEFMLKHLRHSLDLIFMSV